MWPGPLAWSMTSGIPAIMRFHAPFSGRGDSSTDRSCQSRTWWLK